MTNPSAHELQELEHKIELLLHGRGPELQGAVLLALVAIYFAGHHPAMRDEAIELWVTAMRGLIPVSEAELFRRIGGKPEGWETQ
jgi:hypothetical protein